MSNAIPMQLLSDTDIPVRHRTAVADAALAYANAYMWQCYCERAAPKDAPHARKVTEAAKQTLLELCEDAATYA